VIAYSGSVVNTHYLNAGCSSGTGATKCGMRPVNMHVLLIDDRHGKALLR